MPPPPTPPTVPKADPKKPISVAKPSLQLTFNSYTIKQRKCECLNGRNGLFEKRSS